MKRRFRVSIYLDVFIEEGDNETLEQSRAKAEEQVRRVITHVDNLPSYSAPGCCNLYVGGVAHYTPENLLKPLDREI